MKHVVVCTLLSGLSLLAHGAEPRAVNQWEKVEIDWKAALPKDVPDARWVTTDGFSDSVYRTKTGSVLIRTGIESKQKGYSPGFYTNTTVEWDLKKDAARVVDIASWGGGSYGNGKLLPDFARHPTPTPRHTYDGICYVPDQDALWMMLGANWRIGGKGANEDAKTQLAVDNNESTWQYSFKTKRWQRIEHNIRKFFPNGNRVSPYESHLTYWPKENRLLFFDSRGVAYAEFDLAKNEWQQVKLANECPMSLYNARSTWDDKRGLWVFRLGPKVCTFDPTTKKFAKLPDCWDLPEPKDAAEKKKDKRWAWKPICYIGKHDVYLVPRPTGNDTRVYDIEKGAWRSLKAGDIELVNGYCHYDPATDSVVMNYQLKCFRLRYRPE